jgi:hypothetical protein
MEMQVHTSNMFFTRRIPGSSSMSLWRAGGRAGGRARAGARTESGNHSRYEIKKAAVTQTSGVRTATYTPVILHDHHLMYTWSAARPRCGGRARARAGARAERGNQPRDEVKWHH